MIPIREPLNADQVAQHVKDGVFKACLEIDLVDIIEAGGMNDFNELAEQRLLECGILSDMSYKVVGHQTPQDDAWGTVLIEVTATVIEGET